MAYREDEARAILRGLCVSKYEKDIRKALAYDPGTGIFIWLVDSNGRVKKGSIAGCPFAKDGYLMIQFQGKQYRAARLAWWFYYGTWPINQIDHINGDRKDNRISNLRDIPAKQNSQNKKCHREGHLLGANKVGNKWAAKTTIQGKRIWLGIFDTEIEAHEEYLRRVKS
jgi:hypothetical protein